MPLSPYSVGRQLGALHAELSKGYAMTMGIDSKRYPNITYDPAIPGRRRPCDWHAPARAYPGFVLATDARPKTRPA